MGEPFQIDSGPFLTVPATPGRILFFFQFKKSGFSVVYKWFKIPIVEGDEIYIYFGVFWTLHLYIFKAP